eukprot:1546235-Pyramimonas_sp.AAC.1
MSSHRRRPIDRNIRKHLQLGQQERGGRPWKARGRPQAPHRTNRHQVQTNFRRSVPGPWGAS